MMKNISELINQLKTSYAESSRATLMQNLYYAMVEKIVQGKYEEVAEYLSELRDREFSEIEEIEMIRRLITVRLSLKRGDPGENISWIKLKIKENSWMHAERLLVEGHWHYHLQTYAEGIECFYGAEKAFHILKMYGREFISHFNGIIGEVIGPLNLDPNIQLEKLRALELRVTPHLEINECARVKALIHRQKAHAFEDLNRMHASLEEISKAIEVFELIGPTSDYQLALLHAADISIDLQENFRARTFFDYIILPVDARVEFPMAFITWRLGGPLPDKNKFAILPGGWIEKFEKLKINADEASESFFGKWNLSTGEFLLSNSNESYSIKSASLEGRLLKLLAKEKATKNFLIETLWPLESEIHLLDNRLHRLISRLNKKFGNLVTYDGKYYILQVKLQLL